MVACSAGDSGQSCPHHPKQYGWRVGAPLLGPFETSLYRPPRARRHYNTSRSAGSGDTESILQRFTDRYRWNAGSRWRDFSIRRSIRRGHVTRKAFLVRSRRCRQSLEQGRQSALAFPRPKGSCLTTRKNGREKKPDLALNHSFFWLGSISDGADQNRSVHSRRARSLIASTETWLATGSSARQVAQQRFRIENMAKDTAKV
jgi:hypothetical protein